MMANEVVSAGAQESTTPTPISDLNPELSDLNSRVIDGSVTITWPYSASKRMLAFVLADHDFRKRRSKGQVRLEFHGAAGRALDKAKVASGDALRLSLDGAEWHEQGPQPGLTGEPLGWQLKFSRKLSLSLKRLESTENETINIDDEDDFADSPALFLDDAPLALASPFPTEPVHEAVAPQTPLMNVSTKRLASAAFDNIEEYVSPAFLKRAKVSYGSLFEGGFEALEEESSKRSKKGRRKSRFSMPTAAWRYSSRSPSPERDAENDASSSEEEVAVPGLLFGKSTIVSKSKTPEPAPEPVMVSEAAQTIQTEGQALNFVQEQATLHSTMHDPFATPQDTHAPELPNAAGVADEQPIEPLADSWMSGPPGELPVPLDQAIPETSHSALDSGLAMDHEAFSDFTSGHNQFGAPTTSNLTQNIPATTAANHHNPFAVHTNPQDRPFIGTGFEHQMDHMYHDQRSHSDVDVSDVPSPNSIKSQPADDIRSQPQPEDTIEILSSSPIRSPRALQPHLTAEPVPGWYREEDEAIDPAVDEGDIYGGEEEEEEEFDEDAEGSAADPADWTHDATPNDDTEVPGEDYDLRKYDDAQEDDEDGNIDRDSLLSTDGEGNEVPVGPGVISPSVSDDEEEGAALDVDDDVDDSVGLVKTGDVEHVYDDEDPEDDEVFVSGAEEDNAEAQTELEDYDEEEMGHDEEEGDYDEEEVDEEQQPQAPVYIDLLSDSDDDDDTTAGTRPQPAPQQVSPQVPQQASQGEAASSQASPVAPVQQVSEEPEPAPSTPSLENAEPRGTTPIVGVPGSPPATEQTEQDDVGMDLDAPPEEEDVAVPNVTQDEEQPVSEGQDLSTEPMQETIEPEEHQVVDPVDPVSETVQAAVVAAEARPDTVATPEAPAAQEGTGDLMEVDTGPHHDEPEIAAEAENLAQLSTPTVVISGPDSTPDMPQETQTTSQVESQEPTYVTQPPMSFDDSALTQSDLSTQTMGGSQIPPTEARAPGFEPATTAEEQTTEKPGEVTEDANVQQLMTPSETQQVEQLEELDSAVEPEREESLGPDDQLQMEMQLEADKHGDAPQSEDAPAKVITECDELAAIEDEAEHDSSLAKADFIITSNSLRSHDHEADEHGNAAASTEDTQVTLGRTEAHETEDHASIDKPAARLRQGRPHRKTRSSGSIDLLVDDASQGTAGSQQSTQETEEPRQPATRASRRRKGVSELDVHAANATQDDSQENTRDLRSSPRGHKRGASTSTTTDQAPVSLAVAAPSQGAGKASNKARLLKILQNDLPEFLPLKVLRNSLHKTVDILAVAAVTPPPAVRPKNGPRDYMLELILTDPSTAPSAVSVAQLYRPHQHSLPVVKAGDIVLLRRFQVLSMKGRGFGVRAGDDSAWAVFERDDKEKLPQITGPPVESTEEEIMYMMELTGWWEGIGEDSWRKAEKAGEKALLGPGAEAK